MKRESPILYMQFANPRVYVVLALGLLVVSLLISLRVENSRFGMSLFAIKQNEPAAEAAGIDTWRWKMLALMLSGALAAAAGGLYAVVLLVVTPEAVFGMLVSAQALILALFGGVGSLWGPVIGAVVLVPLAEGLNAKLGNVLPGIQGVVYGIAIIAIILWAPEGVYWRVRDRLAKSANRRRPRRPFQRPCRSPPCRASRREPLGEDLLVLRDVGISFGGLRALDGVDLAVPERGLYGIIGPNGAGKTTLFNVINGFLAPQRGDDPLRWRAARRAAAEPGVPPRYRPYLSGRARLPAHDRARKCHRRRLCRRGRRRCRAPHGRDRRRSRRAQRPRQCHGRRADDAGAAADGAGPRAGAAAAADAARRDPGRVSATTISTAFSG